MAARGLLNNPAMFAGYDSTPLQCIRDWIDLATASGASFTQLHHHLIYMCERSLSRYQRKYFNSLSSTPAVIDYLNAHLSD